MKPVPHGEPYAGKLHVRFDEGAGVPDNKGRPALLYILLPDERFAAAEWPRDEKEWCHSDLKNVAYYYVSKLYEDLLKGEN